jgi:putative spermidine/putrescine transport system permease protein
VTPAWRARAAVTPALAVVVVLLGGALAGAVRTSLVPLGGAPTLDAWRGLLTDPEFGASVLFTVRIALLTTVLSAVAALAIALALRRRGTALRALAALPVPVPHLLVGVVAVLWLAPGGLAERALGVLPLDLVGDRAGLGVVLVYVYKETPFLVLLALAALGDGVREREEAAATLGLGPWRRVAWVVWPAVRAPLAVGSLAVAAFVVGAFEVPLLVGPSSPTTLSEYALQATQTDLIAGEGTAAAALLVAAAVAIVLAVAAVALVRDADGA